MRCSTLGHRQAGGGLGVGRVGVDELLVLRHRRVDVAALERVLRRGVARVELLLAGLLVDHAAALRGWCRPVKPWAVSCCSTCVTAWRSSSSGAAFWNSGIGRPCATRATSGTDGICIAWAIWGTASMSTRPSRKRPSNSLGQRLQVVGQRTLSGERLGLSKASSTGAVREPSSSSWKFCSVTATAYAAAGPDRPGHTVPATAADRTNPPPRDERRIPGSWPHSLRHREQWLKGVAGGGTSAIIAGVGAGATRDYSGALSPAPSGDRLVGALLRPRHLQPQPRGHGAGRASRSR